MSRNVSVGGRRVEGSGPRLEATMSANGLSLEEEDSSRENARKVEFNVDSDLEYSNGPNQRKSNAFETYERIPSSMKSRKSEPPMMGRSWVGSLLKNRSSVSPVPRKMPSRSTNSSPISAVRDERPGGPSKTFWFRKHQSASAGVEIWPGQHKPRVLYAPPAASFGKNVETAGIGCNPGSPNLVYVGDSFHITVEGFYTTPHDFVRRKSREFFLYSIQFDRHCANQPAIIKVCYDARSREANFVEDAYSYTGVTAPGKLLMSSVGQSRLFIDLHLRLLQVDDSAQARKLLSDVAKLSDNVLVHLKVSESKATLTEILGVLGSLSQGVVDRLGETEHVLNADAHFKLARRSDVQVDAGDQPIELDSYLRYGLYYFLRRPSRAKLYSQTSTMDNARLMVRLTGDETFRPEYAEFAETDYVGIRVHRGAADDSSQSAAAMLFVDDLYASCPS